MARSARAYALVLLALFTALALISVGCQKASEESGESESDPASSADEKKESGAEEGGAEGGEATEIEEEEEFDDSNMAAAEPARTQRAKADEAGGAKDGKDKDGEKKPKETWKRSEKAANASTLTIGDSESLPLKGVQVKIEVVGHRARILADYYYFNDRDQQLEGKFKMRLPSGASPHFLAFGQTVFESKTPQEPQFFDEEPDDWGRAAEPEAILEQRKRTWQEPKVARMVQKEKAAMAYQDTVRQRVDPALTEWSGPGIFTTRVFPLAPQQLHRIVIAYDVDLTWVDGDLELVWDKPEAASTTIDVVVHEWAGKDITVSPEVQFDGKDAARRYRLSNPTEDTVRVRINGVSSTAIHGDDEVGPFFAGSVQPALPETASDTASKAVLVLDTSMSSTPDKFNVWRAMAKSLLDENRDGVQQFAVLFFNVETWWWQEAFVDNTPENVAALLAYVDTLALEGASDVGAALNQAAKPAWLQDATASYDVFFLSDGAATWGESDAHRMTATLTGGNAGAYYGYNTGMTGTDRRFLNHLARDSGGAVFSVVGEAEIKAASRAHRARPWRIEEVRIPGAADILLAGRPTAIFPGQRLGFAGRGKAPDNLAVELVLEQDGVQKTVTTKVNKTGASPLAARAYGEIAVGQLEELGAATESFAVAYARHFRVPGKSASLLMLETEEDYARFNIVPADDARVVTTSPASMLIADALKQIGELLGDPRAAFFDMLRSMQKIEPIQFTVSPQLWEALKAMPQDAFTIPASGMTGRSHLAADLGPGHADRLAKREIDYDQISIEAQQRMVKFGGVDALKALSSLVENSPGDTVLARDIAYTAMEWKQYDAAYHLLKRVAAARPYEPQTYHALAMDVAALGNGDLALAWFEVALSGQWDPRFGAFTEIVSLDYLRFLRSVQAGEVKVSVPEFAAERLKTIQASFPVQQADVLVTISWNTDNTDIDLHVLEPTGEECYYSHPTTKIGGRLTRDVTTGYGPEMYLLEKAVNGKYDIRVKYFASDRNRASTRTKVYVTVIEGWGTAKEKVTTKTVALASDQSMHDVAQVVVGK